MTAALDADVPLLLLDGADALTPEQQDVVGDLLRAALDRAGTTVALGCASAEAARGWLAGLPGALRLDLRRRGQQVEVFRDHRHVPRGPASPARSLPRRCHLQEVPR